MKNIEWLKEQVAGLSVYPINWDKLEQEIASIKNLHPNYDGEGSNPPSKEVINEAVACLSHLKCSHFPAPHTCYSHVNEIFIEWAFYPDNNKVDYTAVILMFHKSAYGDLMVSYPSLANKKTIFDKFEY